MRFSRYLRGFSVAPALRYAALFVAVFGVYALIQTAVRGFPDPDSFYHLKVTQLLAERGIEREFSWLPYTTLAAAYADHHFLYHVLLLPFFAAFGPFLGLKLATAFFGACAVTAFYALLRALGVRWAWAFSLLLATSASFMYRMNLAKTSSLSVALLMLALFAVVKNRPLALLPLSFVYVWLYGGWPILLVVVGTFLAARAVTDAAYGTHPVHSWAAPWFWKRLFGGRRSAVAAFTEAKEVRVLAAVLAGTGLGLVCSPYFPANIRFYWEQIVQIAVLGYKDKIGVGMEWYPFPAWSLLFESGAVFVVAAVLLALLCVMVFWDDVTRRDAGQLSKHEAGMMTATAAIALLFLALTMRSRRHIEYFVPFAMLALAYAWTLLVVRLKPAALAARLRGLIPRFSALPVALATYGILLFAFFAARDVWQVRESQSGGIPLEKYAGAAAWIRANVPAGEVVVHSDWDDFPMLFLHDDTHRYVAGLDATFLYRQDPERYWAWVDMTTGKTSAMAETSAALFGSRTLLIENDHAKMREAAMADPALHKAYQDEDASVFVIRAD